MKIEIRVTSAPLSRPSVQIVVDDCHESNRQSTIEIATKAAVEIIGAMKAEKE